MPPGHRAALVNAAPLSTCSDEDVCVNRCVTLIKTRRFGDDRGWFSETYARHKLVDAGIDCTFVQDNESLSVQRGTVRGIHYQTPPHAQAKLVRCTQGAIADFAVDLRQGSPTFGQSVSAILSDENGDQLFIPIGFGHAFITLTPAARVSYKVSDVYAPTCDGGVAWDDPQIAIDWPLSGHAAVLSDKDRSLPPLKSWNSPFVYDGEPLALRTA